MKTTIIIRCSCGKKWREKDTPENAEFLWKILNIVDRKITAYFEEKKEKNCRISSTYYME